MVSMGGGGREEIPIKNESKGAVTGKTERARRL